MKFIKTTVIGGILFLIPLVVLIIVAGKAYDLMLGVAKPIAKVLPIDTIAGVAIVNILAVVIVIALCFLMGLLAQTGPAKRLRDRVDAFLLNLIPGYAMVRGVAANLSPEQQEAMHPVLVRYDDRKRLGIEVERNEQGLVTVYLPGAPSPWTGTVEIFDAERIEQLDARLKDYLDTPQGFGTGSLALLGAGKTDEEQNGRNS